MPISRARSNEVAVTPKRQFSIAEFGPADADTSLFWFHGTPGGRYQMPPAAIDAAESSGVRIVTLDRPGIGRSTPHRYSSLAAWPGDLERVADLLGIGKFHVGGLSGGGPYALAAAAALPERVQSVLGWGSVAPARGGSSIAGGLAGFASHISPLWTVGEEVIGFVMHRLISLARPIAPYGLDLFAHVVAAPADKAFLLRPETRSMFVNDLLEASRGQFRAIVADARLFSRPWGFELSEVRQPVTLMFGDADNIVPYEHGEHLASVLPNAKLVTVPGGGHISILDDLAEHVRALSSK